MSTIKASNIQNGSSASVNIALNTDGSATFAQMPVPPSPYAMRNKIINGVMEIDQRNAGASGTATGYTVDRWKFASNLTTKGTWQQNAGSVTAPAGFAKYLGFTSNSAYSVASGDYFAFVQPIEGLNVLDFAWGTASAKTVTLSFWVRSSLTGTFGGALKNYDSTRSYPFTYTISAANTWEFKTVTIPGDTSGTWLTTNGIGVEVLLAFGVGSTYSGTAGAWASTNYISATGATSVVGTNGATFYITGVQLEVGSVATPFERRLYPQELAMCQRYYQTYNATTWGFPLFITYVPNGDTRGGFSFVVTMRSAPTVTFSSNSWQLISVGDAGATVNNSATVSVAGSTINGFAINVTNPSTFSPSSGTAAVWGTNGSITYYASAEI
jgi:hypothetical protein